MYLPFTIYHFPFISHLSFTNEKWIVVKLLRTDNRKLKFDSEGGL